MSNTTSLRTIKSLIKLAVEENLTFLEIDGVLKLGREPEKNYTVAIDGKPPAKGAEEDEQLTYMSS